MQDPLTTPSNQPTSQSEKRPEPVQLPWRFVNVVTERDKEACEIVMGIFWDGKPVLAVAVYEAIKDAHEIWGAPTKTVICPRALSMGITKVKRKSGWWWVPPGVKEPTLAATREDPWAEEPSKEKATA